MIALSHLGSDISYEPYDSLSMISHTHGIDVFLDGHSHSLISEDHILNKNGEEVLLCSVGTKLQEVGTLIIDKKGQLSVVDMEVYDRKDEATQNYISYIYAELDYVLSEKIGELEFDLDIADDQGIRMVRNRETNLGDFVADAFRYVFDSDIGIINGGGIRDKLPAGEITVRDLLNVTPYQNYGSCILASGQVIMDELESAVKEVERLYSFDGNPVGEAGGFLQVSGLRFTVDTSIPSPVKTDENGTYLGIEGERRIKDLEVLQYGEYVPIDPETMYTVASYDYVLSDESETRHLFYKCEKIIENVYLDIDILKMYFQALDKEDLQSYSKQQGRIIVR